MSASLNPNLLLAIPLAPLVGAVVAGAAYRFLFDKGEAAAPLPEAMEA